MEISDKYPSSCAMFKPEWTEFLMASKSRSKIRIKLYFPGREEGGHWEWLGAELWKPSRNFSTEIEGKRSQLEPSRNFSTEVEGKRSQLCECEGPRRQKAALNKSVAHFRVLASQLRVCVCAYVCVCTCMWRKVVLEGPCS